MNRLTNVCKLFKRPNVTCKQCTINVCDGVSSPLCNKVWYIMFALSEEVCVTFKLQFRSANMLT